MRVIVATVAHHPEDARIRHRQIDAMLDDGIEVVYIAPPGDRRLDPRLKRVEIPRAVGRDRLRALVAARRVLAHLTPTADLTIVHDPELVALRPWIRGRRIWDVHEDLEAQISDKSYLPASLAPWARWIARLIEAQGSAHFETMIAEAGYRPKHPHAVLVRNTVVPPDTVAPSMPGRLIYLGRVSTGRGADVLRAVAASTTMQVDVVGPLDPGLDDLAPAVSHGFVPNDEALPLIEGATAGLCLLRDLPNYRHSMPTKILEYMARGVPVITTPLDAASAIVRRHDCGRVVPFDDPSAVVEVAHELDADDELRLRLGAQGREAVRKNYHWSIDRARLLRLIEGGNDSTCRN